MNERTDIEYVSHMMRCYKELHQKLLEFESEIEWPDCGRPDRRFDNFIKFMENQEGNDVWARYYIDIARYIEPLIWRHPPKD